MLWIVWAGFTSKRITARTLLFTDSRHCGLDSRRGFIKFECGTLCQNPSTSYLCTRMRLFSRNPSRDYSTIICIRLQHIHYGINGIVRFKNNACVREYVFGYEKKSRPHTLWMIVGAGITRKRITARNTLHTASCRLEKLWLGL